MHVLYCHAINRPLESFVYHLEHTQFLLFSNTLSPPPKFCELDIQFTAIETFMKHNGRPNKAKACRLWPTYRLTSISVNAPSNSSPTQSRTKIVGTLRPNAVFFLLVLPFSLSKLFIAVLSPSLVHQHWGSKETQKCLNNFYWDCSFWHPVHPLCFICSLCEMFEQKLWCRTENLPALQG